MSLAVRFVLVATTHAGNVGAAARAMLTMGFEELVLVAPRCDPLSDEALARAAGADALLRAARRTGTLDEAIGDCVAVIGTSARRRHVSVPILDARAVGEELAMLAADARRADTAARVALLFGPERSGLDNDALDRCTRQLRIPCNPDYPSLNLGSAVQVVAYELAQALARVPAAPPAAPTRPETLPATGEQMAHFLAHLDRLMVASGFLDPAEPRQLRRRVRRYFERSRPSVNELAILRGLLAALDGAKRPRGADGGAGAGGADGGGDSGASGDRDGDADEGRGRD